MNFWDRIKVFEGCVSGFQHPSVSVTVRSEDPPGDLGRLAALGAEIAPMLALEARGALASRSITPECNAAEALATLIAAFEVNAFLPVFGRKIFAVPRGKDGGVGIVHTLLLETLYPRHVLQCLQFIRDNLETTDKGRLTAGLACLGSFVPDLVKRRTNNRHLIAAARTLDIPLRIVPGSVFLCGYGDRSRMLNSSSTDRTSASSLDISRDKAIARQFMRQCNVPVADQRIAATAEEAVQAARDVGFPVVVKPRSRDGGVGVSANMRDEAAVRRAFKKARAEDSSVLVERFIAGREFRILIVNGQLLSVHEREPATIVGNGTDSVSDLVGQENARRAREPQTGFTNIAITLGEDADHCLATQGLNRKSVPGNGVQVRLATVPKVATGGATRPVDKATVHADVIAAAGKAARMLRLDVAGIDYIAPDCTRSWRETGGAITEINPIPQINRMEGSDIHVAFLKAALPGVGRVPSLLLTGSASINPPLVHRLAAAARKRGLRMGVITENDDQARELDGDVAIATSRENILSVIGDTAVNCILAIQGHADMSRNGLLLDRFDAVAVAPAEKPDDIGIFGHPFFRPHFRGPVIVPQGTNISPAFAQAFGKAALHVYREESEMVEMVIAGFLAAGSAERGAPAPAPEKSDG